MLHWLRWNFNLRVLMLLLLPFVIIRGSAYLMVSSCNWKLQYPLWVCLLIDTVVFILMLFLARSQSHCVTISQLTKDIKKATWLLREEELDMLLKEHGINANDNLEYTDNP